MDIDPLLARALAHPMRTAILEYLTREREEAGVRLKELAGALGLCPPEFDYHLMVLGDAGLVARIDANGDRRTGRPDMASGRRGPGPTPG